MTRSPGFNGDIFRRGRRLRHRTNPEAILPIPPEWPLPARRQGATIPVLMGPPRPRRPPARRLSGGARPSLQAEE